MWSRVSRNATEALLAGRKQRALALITESINLAEKSPDVPLPTLLALRCKQCQALYSLGSKKDAVLVARAALKQISADDWRQQMLASRFLEVERVCFLEAGDYQQALTAADTLSSLNDKIMGANSLETMRRRVQLVEVLFMNKNFERVVRESKTIDRFFRAVGLSDDGDELLVLLYMGVAQLQLGELDEGRKTLQRVGKISGESGKPAVPGWVRDSINALPQAAEIRALLGNELQG